MPLFDVDHKRFFIGQSVKIVARTRTHTGKNENLVGRVGIVDSVNEINER